MLYRTYSSADNGDLKDRLEHLIQLKLSNESEDEPRLFIEENFDKVIYELSLSPKIKSLSLSENLPFS